MSDANKTYTYRCGERVELEKSTDEIVVRALPAILDDASIVGTEQVSSASTKIKVSQVGCILCTKNGRYDDEQ